MVDGGAEEGQGQGHQMDLEPPSQDAKTLFVGGLNPAITRYSGCVCVCVCVRFNGSWNAGFSFFSRTVLHLLTLPIPLFLIYVTSYFNTSLSLYFYNSQIFFSESVFSKFVGSLC